MALNNNKENPTNFDLSDFDIPELKPRVKNINKGYNLQLEELDRTLHLKENNHFISKKSLGTSPQTKNFSKFASNSNNSPDFDEEKYKQEDYSPYDQLDQELEQHYIKYLDTQDFNKKDNKVKDLSKIVLNEKTEEKNNSVDKTPKTIVVMSIDMKEFENEYGILYKNGFYFGQIIDGKTKIPNGYGLFVWQTGEYYIGYWENGKFEGKNSYMYFKEGEMYHGSFKYGKAEGKGLFFSPKEKLLFYGNFRNGRAFSGNLLHQNTLFDINEKGNTVKKTELNKMYFESYLLNNEKLSPDQNDQTSQTDAKSQTVAFGTDQTLQNFDEEFEYIKKVCMKICFYKNKNERKNISFIDRKVYFGSKKDDKKNGQGCMFFPNDSRYQGMWFDNKQNGVGIYVYDDGMFDIGFYLENKLHLFGFSSNEHQDFTMGFFNYGSLEGPAIYYKKSQNSYIYGIFHDNELVKKIISRDGNIWSGLRCMKNVFYTLLENVFTGTHKNIRLAIKFDGIIENQSFIRNLSLEYMDEEVDVAMITEKSNDFVELQNVGDYVKIYKSFGDRVLKMFSEDFQEEKTLNSTNDNNFFDKSKSDYALVNQNEKQITNSKLQKRQNKQSQILKSNYDITLTSNSADICDQSYLERPISDDDSNQPNTKSIKKGEYIRENKLPEKNENSDNKIPHYTINLDLSKLQESELIETKNRPSKWKNRGQDNEKDIIDYKKLNENIDKLNNIVKNQNNSKINVSAVRSSKDFEIKPYPFKDDKSSKKNSNQSSLANTRRKDSIKLQEQKENMQKLCSRDATMTKENYFDDKNRSKSKKTNYWSSFHVPSPPRRTTTNMYYQSPSNENQGNNFLDSIQQDDQRHKPNKSSIKTPKSFISPYSENTYAVKNGYSNELYNQYQNNEVPLSDFAKTYNIEDYSRSKYLYDYEGNLQSNVKTFLNKSNNSKSFNRDSSPIISSKDRDYLNYNRSDLDNSSIDNRYALKLSPSQINSSYDNRNNRRIRANLYEIMEKADHKTKSSLYLGNRDANHNQHVLYDNSSPTINSFKLSR